MCQKSPWEKIGFQWEFDEALTTIIAGLKEWFIEELSPGTETMSTIFAVSIFLVVTWRERGDYQFLGMNVNSEDLYTLQSNSHYNNLRDTDKLELVPMIPIIFDHHIYGCLVLPSAVMLTSVEQHCGEKPLCAMRYADFPDRHSDIKYAYIHIGSVGRPIMRCLTIPHRINDHSMGFTFKMWRKLFCVVISRAKN